MGEHEVDTGWTTGGVFRRGMRLVARSLRAHPGPHAVAMVGANLFAVAVVAFTIVLGRVTDEVIVPALDDGGPGRGGVDGGDVLAALAVVMGVAAVRGVSIAVRRYFLAMAEYRTQRTWRRAVLERYLSLPLRTLQQRSTGELLAHADSDIEAATSMLRPLAFAVSIVALVVFSLLALLAVHWSLMLVGLVLFPLLTLVNHLYTKRVELPSARAQAALGDVSTIAHESFDGVLVVKTLGREAAEVERLSAAADRLRTERVEVGALRALFEPFIDALPNLGTVVLVAIGATLVADGQATVGEIVRGASIFAMLAMPIRILGYFLEEMPRSVVALDRVDRVLALQGSPVRSTVAPPVGPLAVEADGVRFSHQGAAPLLDGLSLSIPAGGSVALVGSTGAGKSTLVALLARMLDPDTGSIRMGGVPLAAIDEDELRAAVVPVFQETFLFADTIRENLTLGLDLSDHELRRVAALCRADEFIAELPQGYDTVVGERGVTLSGGQRQRVALTRALLRRPRVLLLDDATSAVDPRIEAEILANLRSELDTTLVVVAYRLATIRLADRVLYLADGRIVADGRHEALLARPDYSALVRAYEQGRVA
jgi:ABC-type multidrug transport system fused ATPase/permease subunit